MKLPSDEYQWTSLMISQHGFRWWLDVIWQQAITWAYVDPDLHHHVASITQSELKDVNIRVNFELSPGNVFNLGSRHHYIFYHIYRYPFKPIQLDIMLLGNGDLIYFRYYSCIHRNCAGKIQTMTLSGLIMYKHLQTCIVRQALLLGWGPACP